MSALTNNKSVLAWIDEKVDLVKPDKLFGSTALKNRLRSSEQLLAQQANSSNLIRNFSPIVTFTEQLSTTLHVLKAEHSSVLPLRSLQAPQTTGWIPLKLTKCFTQSLRTATRAEQCTLSPIQWVLLDQNSQRSVLNLLTLFTLLFQWLL